MDKTCENCDDFLLCFKNHKPDDQACEDWSSEKHELIELVSKLKVELAKYKPRHFNLKDKSTWPPLEKLVLICNKKSYRIGKIDSDGEWFDDNDLFINPLLFKPKWWCELPGGEE